MVYIKKLEVYGFKSFGFRNTVVNFDRGLVAVTGPNGSGKSNILDAIMFAIGENSPKALRVDKFQSLFHDSQSSSHRLIRVSLTFENSDRGIPLDSDSVTLTREMEGQAGDSQYYLNGKKVSKATLIELLEIVVAAPNKLNIVQQGMITRISELNPEDRRKIIEDIVGLSYFDEKKTEALKQLDESDRRLEVALARMGEIRKRIDDLEVERNDQLRYEQLETELKRFKAVRLSNNIRSIRDKIALQTQSLKSNTVRLSELSSQIEELRRQLEQIDAEKTRFIQEVSVSNKAKAQIGSKLTEFVYDSERLKASLKENQQRAIQIEKRIPLIEHEKVVLNEKIADLHNQIAQVKVSLDQRSKQILDQRSELEEITSNFDKVNAKSQIYAKYRQRLDERYRRLTKVKNDLDISVARLEEKIKTNHERITSIDNRQSILQKEIADGEISENKLKDNLETSKQEAFKIISAGETLGRLKATLEKEIGSSSNLLLKANTLATKYEAKASVAKNAMNEDLAIAELTRESKRFGIIGLVHQLVSWDSKYERAIHAVCSDWMKAFVVNDVKSMISIAEYAKSRKLPRLKIIPLDVVMATSNRIDFSSEVDVVGILSDFVISEFKNLSEFLLGDVLLVKSAISAYIFARQGYRSVSIDGEMFSHSAGSMSLDFGSKISDLTKALILGDSIDNLRVSLSDLQRLIDKKNSELQELILRINDAQTDRIKLDSAIGSIETNISMVQESNKNRKIEQDRNRLQLSDLNTESESLNKELKGHQQRLSIINSSLKEIAEKMQNSSDAGIRDELTAINTKRNQIVKSIESQDFEYRQIMNSIAGLNNLIQINNERLVSFDEERERIHLELGQRINQAKEIQLKLDDTEAQLKILRDQEQQIIDSSGKSYSVLQEYEQKLKGIMDNERKLSREYNILERDSALLRKDLADLSVQESRLVNDLVWLGYKNLLDGFDVELAIKELTSEFEAIKTRINLRADESYWQVIEGYRSMSSRKNQLETERNSIVLFIEEIVKEKKSVFMDAFQKVDNDIRKTFSEVTGGLAWLEIENTEDVFTSGIMLIVQFPGKPGRESTSLSGGEKTMAATVFLLSLQSLKPSPFYLMDEVDAHLDAQNTERLSKILLERSRGNQIIMVTLKDTTVAKAALIYGVYPKNGVSQVVKYKNSGQVPLAEIISSDGGAGK